LQGALLVGSLLLIPVASGVAAYARFTDPVYATNYEAAVARYATVLAGSQRVTWVGPVYTLHPRDYVFDRADPVTYIYHFYAYQLMFWTHQWVFPLYGYQIATDPGSSPFVYPGIANVLREGDVVVVNAAREGYSTAAMPASLPPLIVEQVHTQIFGITALSDHTNWYFTSPTMSGTIWIHQEAPAYLVQGSALPDGRYELYTPEIGSRLLHSLTLVTVRGGSFEASVPIDNWPARRPGQTVVLLYYGSAFTFPAPGT
jgi:hypothetical protein